MAAYYHCLWCGGPLEFSAEHGWRHRGGGLYVFRCSTCDWVGTARPDPKNCPDCGAGLSDDHAATVDRAAAGWANN